MVWPISPRPETPGGGGNWDEDPSHPERNLQSHGFIALAFGMAMGITLMVFSFLAEKLNIEFVKSCGCFKMFLIGLIGGTLIAVLYNMLLYRHFNLFGSDQQMN